MTDHLPLFAPQFGGSFPPPRPWQDAAHEALREGARNGHRCQMIMAPTGSGKTYLAMRVIHEALLRHRRALFVCDRKTLINQTSEVASDYGLGEHGIIQAQNPRLNMSRRFQIASLQTLAMRGWPEAEVLIIDEAHTQYKTWKDYIKLNNDTRVIGLSATPFTTGLGRLFSNLVNVATMDDLTKQGIIVPLRVFTCHRPDMRGAATTGGEWTDAAAEERELAIVGDVVSEWTRLAEGRKTICFGATIAHCEEIVRQFNAAGIRAATFTARTTEDDRRVLLAEFGDLPGEIHILCSVEALAKGFDVRDVGCIMDCRPLRKSLSVAMQMWGRGLRSSIETGKTDCLLRGSLVLTNMGEIPIENVQIWHKLWDGHEWVSHSGTICKGVRKVITYAGLTGTPDHRVKTEAGWRTLGDCASEQVRIIQTGLGGQAIRESDGCLSSYSLVGAAAPNAQACRLRVRWLRDAARTRASHARTRISEWVSSMREPEARPDVALCQMQWNENAMQEPKLQMLEGLWGARDRIPVRRPYCMRDLDFRESRHPQELQRHGIGSDQQSWPLRAWEYPMGHPSDQSVQYAHVRSYCEDAPIHVEIPRMQLCGKHLAVINRRWVVFRGNYGPLAPSVLQTEGEVWDILNAGPRNCFTVNSLLAHNCVLLDFSGNIIRFADDYAEIFFNGLAGLDQGEKLDKTIRKDEEKKIKRCPQCGFQPCGIKCIVCGHETKRRCTIAHKAGTMEEIVIAGKKYADNKADLYAQLASYAKIHSAPDKVKGRTAHLYHDFTGEWPPVGWAPETAPYQRPSQQTMNKIRSLAIAFAKRRTA